MSKTQRKLAAILFSDIHGFTALMRQNEDAAMDMVRRHNVIMDTAVKRNGGKVVKTIGDSYMVIFDSAVSAVECAFDSQSLLLDYNEAKPEAERIVVRVSIHLGDVLVEGDDVFGDGVNVASRLQKITDPGRICVSRDVYQIVRGKISRPFRSIGTHELKGIPEPLEVFTDEPEDSDGRKNTPAPRSSEDPSPVKLDFPDELKPKPWTGTPDPGVARGPEERSLPNTLRRSGPAKDGGAGAPAAGELERASALGDDLGEGIPHTGVRQKQKGPLTDVVLLVNHRPLMLDRIGGLSVLERQLHTLSRAGAKRVWIATHEISGQRMASLRLPKGLELLWGSSENRCTPPYANVSGDHFIRLSVLKSILSRHHDKPTSYRDAGKQSVVQVVPYRDESFAQPGKVRVPEDSTLLLHSPVDGPESRRWLLDEARKATDSFMARHFDRNISLFVTRWLLDTPVKPNHMTLISTAIGLAGALLTGFGSFAAVLSGAALFWLHTVLDGCDGELARLRFEESRWGGTLDFWGDNLVHFALFASLGAGQWRASGDKTFLLLGAVAAVAALLSALFVYWFSVEKADSGPLFKGVEGVAAENAGFFVKFLAKIEHTLTQRDFVYLFLLVAALGQPKLFLWAAAVGTPVFLVVFLLLLALRKVLK